MAKEKVMWQRERRVAEKGKSVEEETGQEGWKRRSVAKKGVGGKRRVGSISLTSDPVWVPPTVSSIFFIQKKLFAEFCSPANFAMRLHTH